MFFVRRLAVVSNQVIKFAADLTRTMTSEATPDMLLAMTCSIVPQMTHELYKGQCGRVAVIGGCQEYTGAPYFAAISAMKVGADLGFVICAREAAPVIKSYSPELIVHPILDDSDAVDKISELLSRMHSIVIGPGLGRDKRLLTVVRNVVERIDSLQLPMVVDADGVYMLSLEPQLIRGYTKAILTPNVVEFARLYSAVLGRESSNTVEEVGELSRSLGGVTIVKKGPHDVIAQADKLLVCREEGSPRRCGGQGDLLSGSMGVFQHWSHWASIRKDNCNNELSHYGPEMCAAYAACLLTRKCARHAFALNRRSTTTTDLIAAIRDVFAGHFETQIHSDWS